MSTTAAVNPEPEATNVQTKVAAPAPEDSKLCTATVTKRPSAKRGHADHGWLNTYHTFSFAGYYDNRFESFNALRVLNEDRVTGGNGFGTHSHREFEIFSYIVGGALLHQDSMANKEVLRRGDVQFTSAGTGISHSEYNASQDEMVHFIQIWVQPNRRGLKPSYQTKSWTDADKVGRLCPIIMPIKTRKTIRIHANLKMYATILQNGQSVELPTEPGRDYYIHVIDDVTGFREQEGRTGLLVNDEDRLSSGDGAFIRTQGVTEGHVLRLTGDSSKKTRVEALVFDLQREG